MNDLLNIARSLAAERKKKVEVAKANIADITIDLTQLSISKEYKYQYIRAYIPNVPLYGIEPVDVFYAYLQKSEISYFLSSSSASGKQPKKIKTAISCSENRVIQFEIERHEKLDPKLKSVIEAVSSGDYITELSEEEYLKLSNENETDFFAFCTYV